MMSFGVLILNYASFEKSSHPLDRNDEYLRTDLSVGSESGFRFRYLMLTA